MRQVPNSVVTNAPKRSRQKVLHLYWSRERQLYSQLGLPTMYFCGRLGPAAAPTNEKLVEVVGQLMVVPYKRPRCQQCVRTYERFLAYQAAGGPMSFWEWRPV